MFKESFFQAEGVKINFAEGPNSGPPLLLLHGLPGRWQEILPILPFVSLQWHCYALDMRGQGKSGRTPGQYLPKNYVADLECFLKNQLKAPAVLFGFSAGGNLALMAAERCPERVRAIILGDSPIGRSHLAAWMESAEFQEHFTALRALASQHLSTTELCRRIADLPVHVSAENRTIRYAEQPGMDPVHIQQLASTISRMDPGVLEYHAEGRVAEYLRDFQPERIIQHMQCPLLLLQADPSAGGMMTDATVRSTLNMKPETMHVMLKDTDHGLGMDTWQVSPLLRAVMSFLDTL
jgi:pimeloyl-ACP methyl ester carboxylesterase